MNVGIGLSVSNFSSVPTVGLDLDAVIAALFSSGEEGAWYDPSDSSTVWQDAAGTTPAGVGDPVGRIDDKSGNGNHATQTTSAARPVLQQSGDLYYLDFDGVDDWMTTVSFAVAQTQPNTLAFGVKYDVVNPSGAQYTIDSTLSANRNIIFINNGNWTYNGGLSIISGSANTLNNVFLAEFNTTNSSSRINGSVITSGQNAGTELWTGVVLAGSYAGTVVSNARIYSFVGVNRTLTAGEITDLETYLASKSGVTL